MLSVEQLNDELPAWELLGQRGQPTALQDPPNLEERFVLDLTVLEGHLLTQGHPVQQLLDPAKIAVRPIHSLRDRVVVGAMLDQDAPTPLDEHRPEQPPERERQISVTPIVNLPPRIKRTPPHNRDRSGPSSNAPAPVTGRRVLAFAPSALRVRSSRTRLDPQS
jgi:hypothetical protein